MKYILQIYSIKNLFILILSSLLINQNNFIFANTLDKNNTNNLEIQSDLYILGPGDDLNIKFLNDEELSTNVNILSDGSISLPLVEPVIVSGLTIKEATKKISEVMSKELIKPLVQININKSRPVNVSVIGELKRPGIYMLNQNFETNTKQNYIYPRLSDAIQKAGGITPNSDLNEVVIARRLPNTENAQYKMTSVNLLKLITTGQQEFNPFLFDGDIIKIKKSDKKIEEFIKVSKVNFIEQNIEVNVIGEVANPSTIKMPPNSSLIQGIFKAGGFVNNRANKSNVQLIRVNKERGTISRKNYFIDLNKGFNKKYNPLLMDNDVVIVNRSSLAKVSDSLYELSKPISSSLQIYTLLKILN